MSLVAHRLSLTAGFRTLVDTLDLTLYWQVNQTIDDIHAQLTGGLETGLGSARTGLARARATNLAAIVFSAGLVLLLSGFRPRTSGRGVLRKRLAFTLLAVIIVAIPLFGHTRSVIRDLRLESAVIRAVEGWDADARVVEITADVANGAADVRLLIVSRGDPEPVWELAERIRDRFGGPVELEVLYQGDEFYSVSAR